MTPRKKTLEQRIAETGERFEIVDRKHPHCGEIGPLTGKFISVLGTEMAEVRLENCKHGTGGCFATFDQIRLVAP